MAALKQRILYSAAWTAILATLLSLFVACWWMLAPHQGLVSQITPPLQVKESVVQAGGVLQYTVHYCVDESLPLPITVDRVLELQPTNSEEPVSWPVAPTIAYTITQRCETKTRLMGVPSFIPAGTYHIHSTTSLQVNPLRPVKQYWQSGDFLIVKTEPCNKTP
jgi:hypothetical protein